MLCRDAYGSEEVITVEGETESVACSAVPKGLEIIDVAEVRDEKR